MTRRTSRAEIPHLTCHARAVRQSGQATQAAFARVWMAHAVASVHRLERVVLLRTRLILLHAGSA
jgi:hypothetical protein